MKFQTISSSYKTLQESNEILIEVNQEFRCENNQLQSKLKKYRSFELPIRSSDDDTRSNKRKSSKSNGLENRSERERAVDRSLDQKANVTKVVQKANRKESDTRVRAVQKIVPMKALKPKAVHMMRKIKKIEEKDARVCLFFLDGFIMCRY